MLEKISFNVAVVLLGTALLLVGLARTATIKGTSVALGPGRWAAVVLGPLLILGAFALELNRRPRSREHDEPPPGRPPTPPAGGRSPLGPECAIQVHSPLAGTRTLRFFTVAGSGGQLTQIDWATFGTGIERLEEQISNYGKTLAADAAIGINDAGLAIALFLNAKALDRVRLGYLRVKGSGGSRQVAEESLLPDLPPNPTILLTDFELKSGLGLRVCTERLRSAYGSPRLYVAVFGAMSESHDLRIADPAELLGWQTVLDLGIEDVFFASVIRRPGIEPPLRLR